MWLTITLIMGNSVLFLELLKFLQTYETCFHNDTLLHIKRLYLEATEIELDFCFNFFAFCIFLKEFGRGLELTENWVHNVFKSINWTKRKGTTEKVKPSKKFFEEEKFTFQRKISDVILDHDVPSALALNLDQTALPYVSPGKYTVSPKGSKNVLIKGLDDKRQITATFVVSATGFFLLIPLIYQSTS